MKIDPYKHKEKYQAWKKRVEESGMPGISKTNADLIFKYITDMEHGLNVSAKSAKGSRSYIRLNTLRDKMLFFSRRFKELYSLDDITKVSEEEAVLLFSRMRKGEIKRQDGKDYVSVSDFVKGFKAFWHWHQKINRKKGIEIPDITTDLDSRPVKPKWVYLTEDQLKKLCEKAKPEYRVLMMFLLDSGIRSPTELVNIKVSDLYNNCKELSIREEISKTFGRRIKLMICSGLLKDYIAEKEINGEDYLFPIKSFTVNKYLKRLAERVLGNDVSPAGQKYSDITMYDFRHISCCYWLPRYKSESALKYRFGWKKSDKIHYYSELLGMKDTISEEDLLVDITKTEIEKRLTKSEQEAEFLREDNKHMKLQMKTIMELVIKLESQMGVLA